VRFLILGDYLLDITESLTLLANTILAAVALIVSIVTAVFSWSQARKAYNASVKATLRNHLVFHKSRVSKRDENHHLVRETNIIFDVQNLSTSVSVANIEMDLVAYVFEGGTPSRINEKFLFDRQYVSVLQVGETYRNSINEYVSLEAILVEKCPNRLGKINHYWAAGSYDGLTSDTFPPSNSHFSPDVARDFQHPAYFVVKPFSLELVLSTKFRPGVYQEPERTETSRYRLVPQMKESEGMNLLTDWAITRAS
jgi:hypothetical protein